MDEEYDFESFDQIDDLIDKSNDTIASNVNCMWSFSVYTDDTGMLCFNSYEVMSDDENDNELLRAMTQAYFDEYDEEKEED